LRELSSKDSKFFLPDIGREEPVADSLVETYEYEDLIVMAGQYVSKTTGPIMVFNFAMEVPTMISKTVSERESKEKFLSIVEKTKERMDRRK